MNIEELADEFNNIACKNNNTYLDKRISNILTPRRIRDYISKNIISKGIQDGKGKYYNSSHLEELIVVRQLQVDRLSDSDIKDYLILTRNSNTKNQSLSINTNIPLKKLGISDQDALNELIFDLKNKSPSGLPNKIEGISMKSSIYINNQQENPLLSEKKYQSEKWNEYIMDENFTLKIKDSYNYSNIDQLIDGIKNLLNQHNKK